LRAFPQPPLKANVSGRISPARLLRPTTREPRAFLYVEGPRDREIIEGWAHRTSRRLAECVRESTVILGGRQPARAREHLAEARAENAEARGLCVLDRDQEHAAPAVPDAEQDGLELFVWSRRHIESYLIVPAALRRVLRDPDPRALRALAAELPALDDERGWHELDAKRRLGTYGQRFPWGRVARSLREEELHLDVRDFLGRLATLFGVATAPHVVHRGR
jgi:hypothetical protein